VFVLKPVDSDVTLLLVVLRPVDSDDTLLFVVDNPVLSDVTSVDSCVDSDVILLAFVLTLLDRPATVLFVVDRPVLSDVTPLCAVLIPVEVEVDSEYNWLPFTASVLEALTAPGATLVNVTADVAPVPPSVTFACVESSY